MRAFFALNQTEARFAKLGEYSQNMFSEAIQTSNIASLQLDKYPELGLQSKSLPDSEQICLPNFFHLKDPHTWFARQKFTQLRMGLILGWAHSGPVKLTHACTAVQVPSVKESFKAVPTSKPLEWSLPLKCPFHWFKTEPVAWSLPLKCPLNWFKLSTLTLVSLPGAVYHTSLFNKSQLNQSICCNNFHRKTNKQKLLHYFFSPFFLKRTRKETWLTKCQIQLTVATLMNIWHY